MRAQGQVVEVSYADESSQEPAAWWEAMIVSKKGPFCKVHFLCGSFPDEAMDDELIRPATTSALKPMYSKQTVQLPNETHAFFLQNEAKIMGDVREKAQLLAVMVEKSRAQIKLVGSSKSIAMGKMLIGLHVKHHGDMHRIQSEREVRSPQETSPAPCPPQTVRRLREHALCTPCSDSRDKDRDAARAAR